MHRLTYVTTWTLAAISCVGCARYAGHSVEVAFRSTDGTGLAGTVVTPREGRAPFPGVVVLHGAEPATRSLAYRLYANIFLERGIAVLLYDKRGAGQSSGDHDSATYAQLVDDAASAIDFLRQRPGIDPARVGLLGVSESGWFTPELAERAGGVAFVINKVGPCSSWRDTNEWETYNDLLADGIEPSVAAEQVAAFRRVWDYYVLPTEVERSALEASLAHWADRDDSRLPAEPRSVSASYVEDISYDPSPFLERATTPMLYVYGSEDPNIPTEQCVTRLTEIQRAGVPVSFHVLEGEGHELGGLGLTGYALAEGFAGVVGDFASRHVR